VKFTVLLNFSSEFWLFHFSGSMHVSEQESDFQPENDEPAKRPPISFYYNSFKIAIHCFYQVSQVMMLYITHPIQNLLENFPWFKPF